jgi:hypothetical protein
MRGPVKRSRGPEGVPLLPLDHSWDTSPRRNRHGDAGEGRWAAGTPAARAMGRRFRRVAACVSQAAERTAGRRANRRPPNEPQAAERTAGRRANRRSPSEPQAAERTGAARIGRVAGTPTAPPSPSPQTPDHSNRTAGGADRCPAGADRCPGGAYDNSGVAACVSQAAERTGALRIGRVAGTPTAPPSPSPQTIRIGRPEGRTHAPEGHMIIAA